MKKLITLEQLSAALAKVAALLKSHVHSAATSSKAGFLSAAGKEKLDENAAGANKDNHPTYPARTGVPTANQTPAFGGTFTVSQPVSDGTGHISAINSRTITIPNSVATT